MLLLYPDIVSEASARRISPRKLWLRPKVRGLRVARKNGDRMHPNFTNVIFKIIGNRKLFLFCVLLVIVLPAMTFVGCAGDAGAEEAETAYMSAEQRPVAEVIWDNLKKLRFPVGYRAVYENAARTERPGSLEIMHKIVAGLGEAGYAAVDSRNQVDMVNPEMVLQFCETVEAGETGTVTIIVPDYAGGLVQYDLRTSKGAVDVVRRYAQYEKGFLRNRSAAAYPADVWQYTEEGYLLFGGTYGMAESYVLVMDDEPDHAALRVAPLDETCRELNRQYILPVGYRQNNLFLTDWSEDDFSDLDFYDLFDRMYADATGYESPYVMARNPNAGIVYSVPEKEFEVVIMRHFKIEQDVLRSRTFYAASEKAYEYRPRGFYETGYSDIPYPEVVGYEEKADGTIEMTVNAVYPYENKAKAFTHKVVVRPLQDGSFQYVSNRIVTPEEDCDTWWHTGRLTMEEWKAFYGMGERERSE